MHQRLPRASSASCEVIYRCPTCGDLLEVQHDMEALKSRLGRRLDPALRRPLPPEHLPLRLRASGARRSGSCPFIDNENIVSMYEGNTNLLWADRYGKQLGVEDLWVKQCGNSHTGSFKDLGMTVLVSVVKQMIGERRAHRRRRLRLDRRHLGGARRLLRGGRYPLGGAAARATRSRSAQLVQPLANGALVLSLDTDFDGCMALVQEITKEKHDLPRQLDEQPAHRGAEDRRHRDRAAVRLGGAGLGRHPGRQSRQRQRARARASS